MLNFIKWLRGLDADLPRNESYEDHKKHCRAKKGRCPFDPAVAAEKAAREDSVAVARADQPHETRQEIQDAECDAVVRKYTKFDGTKSPFWMKAPNGKPTNLSERQWVLVRTPSFKRWFGDWEAVAVRKQWKDVEDPNVLCELRGEDISGIERAVDKSDISKIIASFGKVHNRKDGRIVSFPNNTAGKLIFVKSFVRAFKSLFEGSVRIYSEDVLETEGHKKHENVSGVHQYVNRFTYDGNDYFVRFAVRENKNGNPDERNNVHAAIVSDVGIYQCVGKVLAPKMPGFKTGWVGAKSGGKVPHADSKIAFFVNDVNPDEVSKAVDENGEPKVVRETSDGDPFSEFERDIGKGDRKP